MAAAFAGVGAIFGVNLLITPVDSMLTEITNEAIGLTGGEPITIVANYFFAVVSSLVIAIVATVVTERVVEPRLGTYHPEGEADEADSVDDGELSTQEKRGLRFALFGFLGLLVVITLLTAPSGAPLRDPVTGGIVGNTPFMDSLLFLIMLVFLIAGIGYGNGAGTIKGSNDVIAAVTKTFAGLAGLVFMLLMISQFIAYFNYSNMPTVAAIALADMLERPTRRVAVAGRVDRGDHVAQHHHPGGRPEVGNFCTGFYPDLRPVGGSAANCAGGLPGGRLAAQRYHPTDGLSAVRRHHCTALPKKCRPGDHCVAYAAVRGDHPDRVDSVLHRVVRAGPSAGTGLPGGWLILAAVGSQGDVAPGWAR